MANWVHCNKCFVRINAPGNPKFLLSNCGHIICNRCLAAGDKKTCSICGSNCSIIPLSVDTMTPDIKLFFDDIVETQQKVSKVVEFQKANSNKLIEHLTKELDNLQKLCYSKDRKYEHAKEYIKKKDKQYEDLLKDNSRLRNLYKATIPSPADSRNRGGRPSNLGSAAFSGNSDRYIVRVQPNTWNSSIGSDNLNSTIRTMSDYNPTPSTVGSRNSMARPPNGVPRSGRYPQPSPGSIHFSGLNFGPRK